MRVLVPAWLAVAPPHPLALTIRALTCRVFRFWHRMGHRMDFVPQKKNQSLGTRLESGTTTGVENVGIVSEAITKVRMLACLVADASSAWVAQRLSTLQADIRLSMILELHK